MLVENLPIWERKVHVLEKGPECPRCWEDLGIGKKQSGLLGGRALGRLPGDWWGPLPLVLFAVLGGRASSLNGHQKKSCACRAAVRHLHRLTWL